MTDIAARAYNHSFRMDPVVRTLLDTDFYKLLMLQMIWKQNYRDLPVTFSLINRSKKVRIADEIDIGALREQLDHARTLRFTKAELIWLQGNTFYGVKQIFEPDFIEYLRNFALPAYDLNVVDGQYQLIFEGPWSQTSMWEIPALSIINELRARASLKNFGRFELDVLYARAKSRLWDKIDRLKALTPYDKLHVGDFGTRRRHGYLWQRWCCEALQEGLGSAFAGTSNVHIAMQIGAEAIGTNAHELAMAYAALAGDDDQAVLDSRYKVLDDWAKIYGRNLQILLPDAYGTTRFLRDAPPWVAKWTGARPDSKDPFEAGREFHDYWTSKGESSAEKLVIFSDGMTIDSIESTFRDMNHLFRISYGWGTTLTNDFARCSPRADVSLDPISLVCKVAFVNGRPAVKLSDNPAKATGPYPYEIDRYLRIFGHDNMTDRPVIV